MSSNTGASPSPSGPASAKLTVHVLGAGSGRPTARRDTTSLLIAAPDGWTLVECPGGIVHKLARWGVVPERLRRVILTHSHVDHVYGLPHLLHAMAIADGGSQLVLHAPEQTLATVRQMMATHDLTGPGYPVMELLPIAMEPGTEIVGESALRICCTPTRHGRDTVALRFETRDAAFGHSSDTCPSEGVAALCQGVDLLLHDCGGFHADIETFGAHHSSALQAGEIAAAAGAGALALIHLGAAAERDEAALASEAASAFDGPVCLAHDGDRYGLPRVGTTPARLR